MFRFSEKIDDLFTPVKEGTRKERFAYLFSHRQSMPAELVMKHVLSGFTTEPDECIVVLNAGRNYTIQVPTSHNDQIIRGELTTDHVPFEHWAEDFAVKMGGLKQRDFKVAAVVLDGLVTEHVEALAAATFEEGHDMPNSINRFYRKMRGLVCGIHEIPLIVRHPLRHDSVLPSHYMEELVRYGWHLGSNRLDQEFDATAAVFEEDGDTMIILGKLRGGVNHTHGSRPRVKL